MVTGIQTSIVPIKGTTVQIPVTSPHKIGEGTPQIQYPIPATMPWQRPRNGMPKALEIIIFLVSFQTTILLERVRGKYSTTVASILLPPINIKYRINKAVKMFAKTPAVEDRMTGTKPTTRSMV